MATASVSWQRLGATTCKSAKHTCIPRLALLLCAAQGLSEPLGALVSMLLLRPFLDAERLQYVLAGTGGLMVSLSLCQAACMTS